MSQRAFWEHWSTNFPLTIVWQDAIASTGTPEGVVLQRAGKSVFITRDDFQVIAGEFSEPVVALPSESNIEDHSNLDKALGLVTDIARLKDVQRAVKNMFAHRELDGGVKAAFDHPLYTQAEKRIEELEEALIILI